MNSAASPRLPDYLDHILEAIDRIFCYTEDMDEPTFLVDSKTQDAVIRNFEVIGEAARNIERHAPDFARAHPEVPWGDAAQSGDSRLLQGRPRNSLAHDPS